MKTNYIKHLKSFVLSPVFPVLLGILIFILYTVYYTPVNLCDDASSLKDQLDFEIWRLEYNRASIDERKICINNLDYVTSKHTNGGFIHRQVWLSQIEKLTNNEEILLNNIKFLENCIKDIEPNFPTKFDAAWHSKWGTMPKGN